MTKAACALILHFSTLRHCWRSIKSLKKRPSHVDSGFEEWEIIQLWSLLAFHAAFANYAEPLLSYVPLYFYAKMILLTVTILFPGTKFPNYWFHTLLVPGIDALHRALDYDWRTYLATQARLLPWLLVDLVLLPGILVDDGTSKVVSERRRDQLMESRNLTTCRLEKIPSASPSPSSPRRQVSGGLVTSPPKRQQQYTPPPLTFLAENYSGSGKKGLLRNLSPTTSPPNPSSSTPSSLGGAPAAVARSRLYASSMHLRKFSRQHPITPTHHSPRGGSLGGGGSGGTNSEHTRRRRDRQSTSTAPLHGAQQQASPSPGGDRDSRPPSTSPPLFPRTSPPRGESPGARTTEEEEKGRRRRHRKSRPTNERIRVLLTGDANIRIRDFLFDLDLPTMTLDIDNTEREERASSPCCQREGPMSVDRDCELWQQQKRKTAARNNRERRRRRTVGTVLHRHEFLQEMEKEAASSECGKVAATTSDRCDTGASNKHDGRPIENRNDDGKTKSRKESSLMSGGEGGITVRRSRRIAKRDESAV